MNQLLSREPVGGKNNALEGLRGLAAVVVIFSHCVFAFYPYLQNCNPMFIKQHWESFAIELPRTFYNGGFAVCIFFVMSGYVLSKSFFAGREGYLQNAAMKRYLRLSIPVAASIFISYIMINAGLLKIDTNVLPGFLGGAYQGTALFSDAIKDSLWRSLVNGSQGFNYVLWTIRIEFLGSMLLFAYLALFGRAKHSWLFSIPVVFLISTVDPLEAPFYALFFAGAYLNKAGHRLRTKWTHAGALIAALYLGGFQTCTGIYQALIYRDASKLTGIPDDFWTYVPSSIGAVLLVWVAVGENNFSRFLSKAPFVWLGDKSFSVYLLHTFVLSSVGAYIFTSMTGTSIHYKAAIATVSVALISILIAVPFAKFVDDTSVKLANRLVSPKKKNLSNNMASVD